MSWYEYPPYVPVAERRRKAERKMAALKKKGHLVAPVTIVGREIAKTFWGKSWCENLERYSDFESRLPRGRTYVRNGSVVDLQIAKGQITAHVAGSELYTVKIGIAPVPAKSWKEICRDCTGTVGSLVELLQGRLAKGVMDRVCRQGGGLFPSPKEIKLSCSCPDGASMCKHVAATLYGVGARLDESPQLLFALRDVKESELLASVGPDTALKQAKPSAARVLDGEDVSALFGLDMAGADTDPPAAAQRTERSKPDNRGKNTAAAMAKIGAARATGAKNGNKPGRTASAKKKKARTTQRRPRSPSL